MNKRSPRPAPSRATLPIMAAYIALVYVPFTVYVLTSDYDVVRVSISAIAWQRGNLPMIILYATLTLPFLLWQIAFFLSFNTLAKKALIGPLLVGCLALGTGIVFPSPPTGLASALHRTFSQIGAIMIIIAVTIVVVRLFANTRQARPGLTLSLAIVYGIATLSIAGLFIVIGSPAALEVGSSLFYMVCLFVVNLAQARAHRVTETQGNL